MNIDEPYKTITREQFLFHEMRVVASLILENKTDREIVDEIEKDNLFQYPTIRTIRNISSVCLKRLHALNSQELVELIANGSSDCAKQVCLYAMMNYYHIVYDFMTTVIAEKYRTKDMFFSRRDLDLFFRRMQEQNDTIAKWSESTICKSKQVLTKMLVENEMLDSTKSQDLNLILIDFKLKEVLLERKEYGCLAAFNCFEGD